MKLLELFAGSRSIGTVAQRMGFEVFSVDLEPYEGIDLVRDVMDLSVDEIPFTPDVIWASPPCTAFSVASIAHHWTGGLRAYVPKTEGAKKSQDLVQRTIDIINKFPNAWYFIENPRGVLRKLPVVSELSRKTVTYCQYGDDRMKPTDIWTNCYIWQPRLKCKNGDSCHESAPRGARTGTQGRKGAYDRGRIPGELPTEIFATIKIHERGERAKKFAMKQ